MKVSVKSVLKASDDSFECFEQQRIVFRAGNMLCVREIERGEGFFIPLQKQIDRLYCFRVASNRKSIFTAEKHADDVQIGQYWLSGEHKALSLTAESLFFSEVDSLELLTDEYDSNLVYGAAKNRDSACVFLADMGRLKLMAIGFLPTFSDFKIDSRDNMAVSVCGCGPHNYIKSLRYGMSQWEVHEQAYKRVQEAAIQHQILFGGRQLIVTASQIFLFQEHQFLQEIGFPDAKSSIAGVVKVPKGLLVHFGDDSLRLLAEDNDETTFVHVGVVKIELSPQQKIRKMALSHNMEQVVLKTSIHNYFVWGCENIASTTQRSELTFNRVFHSCSHQAQGTVSISTGKQYCLLTGTANATLWSIQNSQTVLSCDFAEGGKRVLLAGAINPDGNSMLLAFEDKVRLYRILLTKFKQVCEFSIKRCQSICFSHGGQLAACKFGRGANSCVTIVSMLRLVELCTFKVQSEPKQLVWNQLDQQLVVSTESNTLQVYRIAEAARVHYLKVPQELTQIRIDHKTKQIVASSQRQVFLIAEGQIVEQFSPPVPHFDYLFPLYGVYFAATTTGQLLWSHSMRFETYHQIPLFNRTFSLVCRNGFLLAHASFRDIVVLRCDRPTLPSKRSSGEEIVMVERDEVIGMFEKVRFIEGSYETLTAACQAKLEEEKQKYQAAIERHRQLFQDQIAFLSSRLAQLASQKQRQEKEGEKVFGELQEGQMRSIADLQRMYDRKFEIQKQKYLSLQQSSLQQKMKYERLILEVEAKYHAQVRQVREEYAQKVREQSLRAQSYKHSNWQQKAGMQMKLLDLQQENELALCDLQLSADNAMQQLQLRHAKLEEEHEQAQIRLHSQQAEVQALEAEARSRRAESEILRKRVGALQGRIGLLQREMGRKEQTIASKDQVIEEQAHRIAGLQKAKYVLSFRTTQIRKQLQPKEEQVDKLKAEMFKLEQEYREEKKRGAQLLARAEKLQRISEIGRREVGDLRIALKHKQRTHDDLCSEIFSLVNGSDPKDWNAHIVRLYQSYISEQQHAGRGRQSDDTTQQLTRHLKHVEQSLMQVSSGTEKVLRGKEKQVMRKMKENSQLVYELNVMRKKENDFSRERRDLHNENARLKRELHESMRTTTIRSQTATGFTRRVLSRESREKSLMLDIRELEKSKAEIKSSRVDRSRLVSTRRTLLAQEDKKQKQSKIFDIARQLQSARTTIRRQDRMIEELNQRLGTTLEQ